MKFKTKPFKHQRTALKISGRKTYFAYLMEQGTGKSWVVVNNAAELYLDREIDLVLIFAPKGVAPGWIKQQFPEHCPDSVPYVAGLWKPKSRATKENTRNLERVIATTDKLRVIVMNIEVISSTSNALDFAIEVLDSARSAMIVIDESHRIKTPGSSVTKRVINLRKYSTYRRILTGTVADKPFDVFSQFQFLSPDILETDSFTAFKAEYAEMMPATHGLMRHLTKRVPKKWDGNYIDDDTGDVAEGKWNDDGTLRKKNMVPAYIPQIPLTDAKGRPVYKNLDKLHNLIAPHSFRVLKKDCLDLPEKLYGRYYTELSDQQQALYAQARDQHRIEWEEGRISTFTKLTVYLRLQQIICGYVPTGLETDMHEIFQGWSDNPRIVSTLEYIADRPIDEPAIIWCRFIEDIKRVTQGLEESYGKRSVVQFYGEVSDKKREENVARFEGERIVLGKSGAVVSRERVADSDRARFMVAQQRAGGLGQTWIAAGLSFYYSNAFSLIDRLQSEDRPHRIGQTKTVNYTDLEAEDTIDSVIIDSLIGKKEVADVINGDKGISWLK